jgi:hypothetical protein
LERNTLSLVLEGSVILGRRTFACRTQPCTDTRVVQLASGPADSALNNSLFDIDTDTAIRFEADDIKIKSGSASKKSSGEFQVSLKTDTDNLAGCRVVFNLQKAFYRSRYVPYYTPISKKGNIPVPTGWMSWNAYFDQAGEKENLDEAKAGAKYLRDRGQDIWSIESW